MRPYRARFREQGVFFAFQSWAGCITNIFGFDLRQAQPRDADRNYVIVWGPDADRHAKLLIHLAMEGRIASSIMLPEN